MQKQTVEQRYQEQQMMGGKPIPKQLAKQALETQAQQNYQKLLNSLKQALEGAGQAVQQVQAANPTQANLVMAAERLTYAVQQVQQLETAGMQTGFTNGTKQQLKQLHNQIETAAGTLSMIQQVMV
jgi:hypothetical protein